MPRKPNAHALTAAFLAVSAGLSVAVLGARNLYDDEISALDLTTSPIAAILRATAKVGIHPPGMFLLAHLAYRIVPSFRWMDLFPCLFVYAGLAVFLDDRRMTHDVAPLEIFVVAGLGESEIFGK